MSSSYTILIVDDEPEFYEFLVKELGKKHQVLIARNRTELQEKLEQRIDLALVDLNIEQRNDGFEFIRSIRTQNKGITIIVATVDDAGKTTRKVWKEAGAEHMLFKQEYRFEEWREVILEYCRKIPQVFISYARKDKVFAKRLIKELKQLHEEGELKFWIDDCEMIPGDSILNSINSNIQKSKFLIAILSQNSLESGWVKQELREARIQQVEEKNIYIIPVKYDNCQPSGLLMRDTLFVSFEDFHTEIENYKEACSRILATPKLTESFLIGEEPIFPKFPSSKLDLLFKKKVEEIGRVLRKPD